MTATAWVDFGVIALSKVVPLTSALPTWYSEFGLVAVLSDTLIIVLGIALAKLLVPAATGLSLMGLAVGIQLIHDVLFYLLVIQGLPTGQNRIIDLFKRYASEGSWKILVADAAMVVSSVYLMEMFETSFTKDQTTWAGLLAFYSLLYILYTN